MTGLVRGLVTSTENQRAHTLLIALVRGLLLTKPLTKAKERVCSLGAYTYAS